MSAGLDKLNTVVVKRYRGTGENLDPELALVISLCEAPTYGLEDAHGARFDWRQDLTRPATADETARYWQKRAEVAEAARERVYGLLNESNERCFSLIERLNAKNAGDGRE